MILPAGREDRKEAETERKWSPLIESLSLSLGEKPEL